MRRVLVRTDHGDAAAARLVAAAVQPDNTAEMETAVEGTVVSTAIERKSTDGLHSTVDDYVVNLDVAAQLVNRPADAPADGDTDGGLDREAAARTPDTGTSQPDTETDT